MTGSLQAQFSFVLRVRIDHRPGMLGRVATAIGDAGGTIGSIDLIEAEPDHTVRDIAVDTAGPDHGQQIVAAIDAIDGIQVIGSLDRTFRLHLGGKIEVTNKSPLKTRDDRGRPARREELEAHGRDGSFRSSVRIVHVDSEGQRKDRDDERRAEREAKRQAEAERLARLGY